MYQVTELKASGVVFEEYDTPETKMVNSIVTSSGAKTACFKDSEGNILAVSQRGFQRSAASLRNELLL